MTICFPLTCQFPCFCFVHCVGKLLLSTVNTLHQFDLQRLQFGTGQPLLLGFGMTTISGLEYYLLNWGKW